MMTISQPREIFIVASNEAVWSYSNNGYNKYYIHYSMRKRDVTKSVSIRLIMTYLWLNTILPVFLIRYWCIILIPSYYYFIYCSVTMSYYWNYSVWWPFCRSVDDCHWWSCVSMPMMYYDTCRYTQVARYWWYWVRCENQWRSRLYWLASAGWLA